MHIMFQIPESIRKSAFRNIIITGIASSLLFTSTCTSLSPTELHPTLEFQYAAWFLDVFFIFRDSLPSNPFAFSTPKGLYESVNERWTEYFSPEEAAIFLSFLTTSGKGLGIWFGAWNDSSASGYRIRTVFPKSPAEKSGLRAFDTITAVNGSTVKEISRKALMGLLRGEEDSLVVDVKRGDSILSITVVKGAFSAPSVLVDSLDSIAYIGLTGFFSQTNTEGGSAVEMKNALDATSGWARHTFIDLRENGGGELNQCYDIVSYFVKAHTDIIELRERVLDTITDTGFTVEDTVTTTADGAYAQRPFTFLVDSNTASASEILVSSVKFARPEVKIVGTHTFGKGRAQILSGTPQDGLVKVTYATLKPPSHPSYDVVGILPDYPVAEPQDALVEATNKVEENVLTKRSADVVTAGHWWETELGRPHTPLAVTRYEQSSWK